MKAKEFKELSGLMVDTLLEKEKGLRKELFHLRFQKTLGQTSNPMRIREVRRDLARVLTVMQAKKESA